ncbi:hypothetical protein B0H14DRAFT_3492677 [Mycena olivaceomarginata]|nr:hypothetical protein B0H14DRAFT_3492677 [Mycena olivaceomarginata]
MSHNTCAHPCAPPASAPPRPSRARAARPVPSRLAAALTPRARPLLSPHRCCALSPCAAHPVPSHPTLAAFRGSPPCVHPVPSTLPSPHSAALSIPPPAPLPASLTGINVHTPQRQCPPPVTAFARPAPCTSHTLTHLTSSACPSRPALPMLPLEWRSVCGIAASAHRIPALFSGPTQSCRNSSKPLFH